MCVTQYHCLNSTTHALRSKIFDLLSASDCVRARVIVRANHRIEGYLFHRAFPFRFYIWCGYFSPAFSRIASLQLLQCCVTVPLCVQHLLCTRLHFCFLFLFLGRRSARFFALGLAQFNAFRVSAKIWTFSLRLMHSCKYLAKETRS